MKRNIRQKALRWSLVFSTLLGSLMYSPELSAQEISKTFTKELKVAPFSNIVSKGPRYMSYASDGRMSSSTRDNTYILIPGGNDDVPALVVKDYQIFTWKENKIRQVVSISVIPDEDAEEEAQQLMDKLRIRLTHHADGSIPIDDNLNIAKFGFVNGFFKRNTNTVTLENGEQFRVKSLIITAQLYIPEESNLRLNTEMIGVELGDLKGKLDLSFQGGTIRGNYVKNMEATFLYGKAIFTQIDTATVNAQVSSFTADQVGSLVVGSEALAKNTEIKGSLFQKGRISSTTTYNIVAVSNLSILETVNDKFYLGKVSSLDSRNSTFSNYEIDVLTKELNVRAKNGDLSIKSVAKGFSSIQLENRVSTISIGLEKTEDYSIKLFENSHTEYQFPEELSILSKSSQKPFLKGNKTKAGKIILGCENCKISITN